MLLSFIRHVVACSVLLSTKDAEVQGEAVNAKADLSGRFPLCALRDGCLQGFSWVGLLKEAVRQIWVVSVTSWCDGD